MSDPQAVLTLMHDGEEPANVPPAITMVTALAEDSRNPGESDADLVTRTTGDLPSLPSYDSAYANVSNPSGWEGYASAARIVGDDCLVWKCKAKVWHSPPATAYLKAWVRSYIKTDNSGTKVYNTSYTPYEWFGTGEPCLPSPANRFSDLVNVILSSEYDIPIPATISDITDTGTPVGVFEIYKYSYIPGYVPPDDGSANGFPTP